MLVIAGQIDELEINNSEIIVKQKSLIPFLKSIRKYRIEEIEIIKRNSNYIEGEGLMSFTLKRRKSVEVIFKDGSSEIINSKLHPGGLEGLVKEIESKRNNANNI